MNDYVSTTITMMIALYATLLRPELPSFIKTLFNNLIFKIIVLFLIVVHGNNDPKMAIMITIGFVLTLDYIGSENAKENFDNIQNNLMR